MSLPLAPDVERELREGRRVAGTVGLRAFDLAVVEALWAVPLPTTNGGTNFFIPTTRVAIPGLIANHRKVDTPPAPGDPGISVIFSEPADLYERSRYPWVLVTRSALSPALNRLHRGLRQYEAPAPGALPVSVRGVTGFSHRQSMEQAVPYDLTYSLSIKASSRGGGAGHASANAILDHVMRCFPPQGAVYVRDSIGSTRGYDCFQESIDSMDENSEVTRRSLGFTVSLRVEGELDLGDPTIHTVNQGTVISISPELP